MKRLSKHAEWLSLLDVSGPFLGVSVLDEAFPQGLEAVETPRRRLSRAAYEEWHEAADQHDALLPDLHREWIRLVLAELLEYDEESLRPADAGAPGVHSQDGAASFRPDWIVRSPASGAFRLFIAVLPPDADLDAPPRGDDWPAPPPERMTLLCREHGVRLGLLTNGERWMLVNAPVGSISSQASWYARLWFQEPATLQAFQSLLGVRRCFGPEEETLESLLEKSLEHHEEVTDTLGAQVRRAVEVLIQCLDKADADRNRELLRDVAPAELYEAGLTVMMRLVFLLCAEERGLLLLGDPVYDAGYAVSTLRGQLAEAADRHGLEVLDRRYDAWARLLAVFRAVFGGIEHEALRLPALGGSLFDPDRFPFLEGRGKGTTWRKDAAAPLPIDNRTVLLLLNALQVLEQPGGALPLSYRALDVEQIGHVYEGLLEHTVKRVSEVTLGLRGSQKAKNPNASLSALEAAAAEGDAALARLVQEITGRSESAVTRALAKEPDADMFGGVRTQCGGDAGLAERIRPFANLLRADAWDDPIVYHENSFMVTLGADRRETGTHYTPKSLTETIVATTLEPVVYVGPAEGAEREAWRLKSSAEILGLKVCDPAMGSGAFLVQACRYLGERLVEAWRREEEAGKSVTIDGEALDRLGAAEPLPAQTDERLTIARRLVAERCLYGVDINPLAVELAKLSIWLVTLAKNRPFGFLDHNLRCGDSLLGIHRLDQLTEFSLHPGGGGQLRLFGRKIEEAVNEAVALRRELRAVAVRDIRDVEEMARLHREAREKIENVRLVADALIGEALRCGGNARALDAALDRLAVLAGELLDGKEDRRGLIKRQAREALAVDLPAGKPVRRPLHWPLEFPEIFTSTTPGFDATFGNPPWGASLSKTDIQHLKNTYQNSAYKLINSFKFFIERMDQITRNIIGAYSFLVPSSLLEHIGCRDIRALLLSRSPYMFIDCRDGIFHGVTQSCCFGIINNRAASEDHKVVLGTLHEYYSQRSSNDGSNLISKTIQQIKDRKNSVLSNGSNQTHISGGTSVPLSELADVFDSGIDYSRAALGKAVFYSGKSPNTPSDHQVLRGRNIGKYSLSFEGIWLRNNWRDIQHEHIAIDSKSRLKVNEKVYIVSPKILVRQTGDRIITTVDVERFYHQKSLLCIVPKAGVSAFFLCAVLNHPKMTEIYRGMTMQSGKIFSQIKKNFLEQLPIPSSFDPSEKERIAALAESLICAHEKNPRLIAQLEDEVAKGFSGEKAESPKFAVLTEQEETP